jgi:6-phosphogluconate dehydrogenase
MKIGMVGLGKMGANMVRRLVRSGHSVVANARSAASAALAKECGAQWAGSIGELVGRLDPPRVVWLMIPAGAPVDAAIAEASAGMSPGDILIDGGNSNFRDSMRRSAALKEKNISFLDSGTSGGVWGLDNGYCLMVGGEEAAWRAVEPILRALAPEDGYARVGPSGSGHFVKMVHNAIEYSMMQALAEGFEFLQSSEFKLDLPQIAELWRHASVVRSWLLDLLGDALRKDPGLEKIGAYVEDSGEGRWTLKEAIDNAVPMPALADSLFARFRSRQEEPFSSRALAALRNEFGGHAVKPK